MVDEGAQLLAMELDDVLFGGVGGWPLLSMKAGSHVDGWRVI
jgi:hypothetical protein